MKFLFVTHRSYPFPGGTEYFVHAMAKEAKTRNIDVTVYAGEHKGDQDQIKISSDPKILEEIYDLIIVHGTDVAWQANVLAKTKDLKSPVLFMLIRPTYSNLQLDALQKCDFVSFSTKEDVECINRAGVQNKAVNVRHSIEEIYGKAGFKSKYQIEKPFFISCGGYWQNKQMKELADLYEKYGPDDKILVLTGYDNRSNLMPKKTKKVRPFLINEKNDVLSGIFESEAMIMHSSTEGFGLVILEAMLNKTPWIARRIAGAQMLSNFGLTYQSDVELLAHLNDYSGKIDLDQAQKNVKENHLTKNTVDDLVKVATKTVTL